MHMRQKWNILILMTAALTAVACSNAEAGAAGGMPGSGYQGADLSQQVLELSRSGDTTKYQLGPDGVHHPLANQKDQPENR